LFDGIEDIIVLSELSDGLQGVFEIMPFDGFFGSKRCLVNFGFDSLSLNRIYVHCADSNTKSRAIPERLGFALEGVFRDGECLYGKYFDLAIYGMLKRNWKNEIKNAFITQ